MRLLLDENLSESVLPRIAAAFPDSVHVRRILGEGATDEQVWVYARDRGLVLVTRDQDFERLSVARGAPPKVVWIDIHNARSSEVASLLLQRAPLLARFAADPDAAVLVLRRQP